ncbi:GDP-mannose 4,6-dehydratase, partial [Burkholderia sp. BCC0801]|uniref:GDP-mannose 4,6-dehydratase n=1 Tax=Burkholderia sp. BCC0801 TaxID=2676291 RepID=UPI001588FD5C
FAEPRLLHDKGSPAALPLTLQWDTSEGKGQADKPDTYVLATNRTEKVRDFVGMAARAAGFQLVWEGSNEGEMGIDRVSGKTIVKINPKFYRPAEVDLLIGDPKKACEELGWTPTTTLEQLCQMMVEADIRRNETGFSF